MRPSRVLVAAKLDARLASGKAIHPSDAACPIGIRLGPVAAAILRKAPSRVVAPDPAGDENGLLRPASLRFGASGLRRAAGKPHPSVFARAALVVERDYRSAHAATSLGG